MLRMPMIVAGAIVALTTATPGIAAAQAAAAPPAAAQGPATIYLMESMRVGPLSADIKQKLPPLQTLQQVEDLLKANRIAFLWRSGEISSADMDPGLVRELKLIPAHTPFVAPQGDGLLIGVILSSRPADGRAAAPAAPPPPAPAAAAAHPAPRKPAKRGG